MENLLHESFEPGWHTLPSGAAWFVKAGKLRYYDADGGWVQDADVPDLAGLLAAFEWKLANAPTPIEMPND